MQLFENLSTPLKNYFAKFVTFPNLLTLLATAWQKHGQVARRTLSDILPNKANLVAKQCVVWCSATDACNPCVLVYGGTGHSLALACVSTEEPLIAPRIPVSCPGSGQNIEKQNIERQISKAKYRSRRISSRIISNDKISTMQNVDGQNIEW